MMTKRVVYIMYFQHKFIQCTIISANTIQLHSDKKSFGPSLQSKFSIKTMTLKPCAVSYNQHIQMKHKSIH